MTNGNQSKTISQNLKELDLHQVWRRLKIDKPYISNSTDGKWRIGFFKIEWSIYLAISKLDGNEDVIVRLFPTLNREFMGAGTEQAVELFYRSGQNDGTIWGIFTDNKIHRQYRPEAYIQSFSGSINDKKIYLKILRELKESEPNFQFVGSKYSFSSLSGRSIHQQNNHLKTYTPRLFSFNQEMSPEDVQWNIYFNGATGIFDITFEDVHTLGVLKRIFLGPRIFTVIHISSYNKADYDEADERKNSLTIQVRIRTSRFSYRMIDLVTMKSFKSLYDREATDFKPA